MNSYDNSSLHEIFLKEAQKHGDKLALVLGENKYTWNELISRIEQLADFMKSKGVKKGDKVAIWSSNFLDLYPCFCAAILNGAVAVLPNSNLAIDEIASLLNRTETSYLIFGQTLNTTGTDEKEPLATQMGLKAENIFGIGDLPEYTETKHHLNFEGDVTDEAFIIFTSGSTGAPKPVVLTQQSLLRVAYGQAEVCEQYCGMNILNAAPQFHIYGVSYTTTGLLMNSTIYFADKMKVDYLTDLIEKENIEHLITVAVMYQKIMDNTAALNRIGNIPKLCHVGGSYISPVEFARFETAFPNAFFQNCYGATETSGLISCTRPNDPINIINTTVGRPNPYIDLRIWDSSKGFVGAGEVGEILTKNTNKTRYYDLPAEKQDVDADGYYHTGDLGTLDEEGNLRIVGRIKDIIIKGGENITPSEVENAILKYDGVKTCKVFGYKDRVYGENLAACLILNEDDDFDEESLRAMLKKEIGSYKIPAYFDIFESFPVNANGKIDGNTLQMQLLRDVNKMLVSDTLKSGIEITKVTVKNAPFVIDALCDMMTSYAVHLGFGDFKATRIRLVLEELLRLRIVDSKENVGEIEVSLTCLQGFMRLTLSDRGYLFDLSKEALRGNYGARIITQSVDDISVELPDSGEVCYNFDFAYTKDFDVLEYLSDQLNESR